MTDDDSSSRRSGQPHLRTTHASGGESASLDFVREKVRADTESGRFDGRVQTRFPPEPNGYLHIGHAKSIYLNFGIADEFGGRCYLRFDDTNPETEETSYVDAIRADLDWLDVHPAGEARYASDYFDQLYAWAESLIEKGLAYVDDQSAETISTQRGGFGQPGVESPFRDRSTAENMELFRGMRDGAYADGERVLRARIDMQADNMWLRDPVLYRIRRVSHHRTGDRWIIYPTYDWAHGQSDAIEGTTHSICTLEFADHRPLYDWCLEHLDLPGDRPEQTEFARLEHHPHRPVEAGPEDPRARGVRRRLGRPRMPTIQGLRRRGFPASAIRAFVDRVGRGQVQLAPSRSNCSNRSSGTELNRSALRRMAVIKPFKVVITNWPAGPVEWVDVVNHPDDPGAGTRPVPFSGELWIEQDDFRMEPPPKYYRLTPGREVRLRAAFFITATDAVDRR